MVCTILLLLPCDTIFLDWPKGQTLFTPGSVYLRFDHSQFHYKINMCLWRHLSPLLIHVHSFRFILRSGDGRYYCQATRPSISTAVVTSPIKACVPLHVFLYVGFNGCYLHNSQMLLVCSFVQRFTYPYKSNYTLSVYFILCLQ